MTNNNKHRGAQYERDVARILGGKRHLADTGGPEDVSHPLYAIQVKSGKTVATTIMRAGMVSAKKAAEGTDKLAALVIIDRRNTRLERYICFDLEDWQARQ